MCKRLFVCLAALALLVAAGCQSSNCCRKPLFPRLRNRLNPGCCNAPAPGPIVAPPAPVGIAVPPLPPAAAPGAPPPSGAYIPPPAPPGGAYNPPPSNYAPPVDSHSYRPIEQQPTWTPSTNSNYPQQQQTQQPDPTRIGARLSTPMPAAPSPAPSRVQLQTPEPPVATRQPASFPVGIPGFAAVTEDGSLTTGLKPTGLDGFDWLQQNRYRTVLHILAPGESDSTDKKMVEKYGMHYLNINMSPESLTRAVEDFERIVNSKVLHPLFVYDKDGMLAGSLWYVHFRNQGLSDQAARDKALPLGLQVNPTGSNEILWVAVQKYLSERRP